MPDPLMTGRAIIHLNAGGACCNCRFAHAKSDGKTLTGCRDGA